MGLDILPVRLKIILSHKKHLRTSYLSSAGRLEHQAGVFAHFVKTDTGPVFFSNADFSGE